MGFHQDQLCLRGFILPTGRPERMRSSVGVGVGMGVDWQKHLYSRNMKYLKMFKLDFIWFLHIFYKVFGERVWYPTIIYHLHLFHPFSMDWHWISVAFPATFSELPGLLVPLGLRWKATGSGRGPCRVRLGLLNRLDHWMSAVTKQNRTVLKQTWILKIRKYVCISYHIIS